MSKKDISYGKNNRMTIDEFNLNKIASDATIVMIAKRRSGKSVVTKNILKHFESIPVGLIISPTDRMNSFYGNFIPQCYIFYNYKDEIISKLLMRQEDIIEKNKDKNKKGKKIDDRAFIVMDDCLSKKGEWIRDPGISELMFNGRHYKLLYILTMQFPLGITPELRSNFDYVFLLAEDTTSNLKRIYEHYAGIFPTFESFKQVFTQLTADFGCMVLVNSGARSSFWEKVFWYKANIVNDEDIKIGCEQYRHYNEKNYNPEWKKKERLKKRNFDVNDYFSKKKINKELIQVNKKNIKDIKDIKDNKIKDSDS